MMVLKWARAAGALVFVHDQFASGRPFRALNIIDDVTRECLAATPDTSISGRRVVRELIALIERRGNSGLMASDKGTEFTLSAALSWAQETKVTWHFIAPGKPMQNGAMNCSTRRCFSASITPARRSRSGRRSPPPSPQHAIGCATPINSADHMLLTPRLKA